MKNSNAIPLRLKIILFLTFAFAMFMVANMSVKISAAEAIETQQIQGQMKDMILDGVLAPGMCFKIVGFQNDFTKLSNATTGDDVKLIDDIDANESAFVLPMNYNRQIINERGYLFKWVPETDLIEVYRNMNKPMRIPGSYCGHEQIQYVPGDKYTKITDVAMESIPTMMPDGFKINLRSVTNDNRGIGLNIMYGYKQDFQATVIYVNEQRSFDLDQGRYHIVIFQKAEANNQYDYWLQIWKKK